MKKLLSIQRFRSRLVLLILLLVVPAFGLVLYANLAQQRAQAAAATDNARALAELAAATQQDIVESAKQLLATLTQFPFLVLTTNNQSSEWHFSNLLKLSPDYVDFGLIETNGELFCDGARTNGVAHLSNDTQFKRVIHARKFSIGGFQAGRLTEGPSVNFGYPVVNERGELVRVIFSAVKLAKLSQAISHIGLPAGGEIMILDRTGTVLAHQPDSGSWVGKNVMDSPATRRILRQEEPVFVMPSSDGAPRLHAVTALSDGQGPSLFVAVAIPLSVSMAQSNRTLLWNCLMLGLVAGAVLLGGWFYSQRYFLRPVNRLVGAAHALAEGDLKTRTGPITGAAELVQLGIAFDAMAQKLEDRQADLLKVNGELRAEILERERAEKQVREQAEEQQKLQAQLARSQRMEGLGALAGGIAHDLNNALAPIIMGSELLREAAKDHPESLTFLDLITASARRCTQMVKQVLSFAKGSRSHVGPVQLPQLIREMAQIVGDTFPKSIAIECQSAPELFSVWGDATELHQILLNLCVNARDAMPRGGRLVLEAQNMVLSAEQARKEGLPSPGRYVLLRVSDTGIGIPEEIRARIFEPFFTTKAPDKGTGLGLSTVLNIVKRHNGLITVESQEGHGTTFKVFLPAQATASPEVAPSASDLPSGKGELILVVDDEQMILELTKTILENYGYRVAVAQNGLEAIACFEARKDEIKLVLTDTDMPVSDGLQAIQAIQRLNPRTPIIVASGMQGDTQRFTRIDTKAVTVLNKPYGIEQLLTTASALLRA